jgi:poly-gamma-glutamate synthesis protein (capsule biosynthesis protein)
VPHAVSDPITAPVAKPTIASTSPPNARTPFSNLLGAEVYAPVPIGDWPVVATSGPPRSFSIAAVGDVLIEGPVLAAARSSAAERGVDGYVFDDLFAEVAPLVTAADLGICHLEQPIGRRGQSPGTYGRSPFGGNLLLAPFALARDLRDAGFDRCSTASNHANDLGTEGVDATLDALDDAGISWAGTGRSNERTLPPLLTVNGVRVAHLAYTNYSNTVRPSDGRLTYATSADPVVADVQASRRLGAEVVIVSIHVAAELQHQPARADRAVVEDLVGRARVDLVVQHGPHVIQPLERLGDTWVYWSLGNFVSGMGLPGAPRYGPPTLDGLVAAVSFYETAPGSFTAAPTAVLVCSEVATRVVHPALAALERPDLAPELRRELDSCRIRAQRIVPLLW